MPRIFTIEDDNLFRETLALAAAGRGYTVMQARDGNDGAFGANRTRKKPFELAALLRALENVRPETREALDA